MEINDIKKVIEALLFVSDKPLLNREIKAVIKNDLPENIKVEDIMKELQQEYEQLDRSFELKFVADGWTFATKSQYSSWIKILLKEKTILKLSPSAMEVLAIIAYKQPITRAEIDNVRGVDSGGVIDTLTDRKFIKIVGRKETLGRPLLYGTTQEFLRHFGLSHLSELPVIENEKDVLTEQKETVQEQLPFDNTASEAVQQKSPEQTEQTKEMQLQENSTNTESAVEKEQSANIEGDAFEIQTSENDEKDIEIVETGQAYNETIENGEIESGNIVITESEAERKSESDIQTQTAESVPEKSTDTFNKSNDNNTENNVNDIETENLQQNDNNAEK